MGFLSTPVTIRNAGHHVSRYVVGGPTARLHPHPAMGAQGACLVHTGELLGSGEPGSATRSPRLTRLRPRQHALGLRIGQRLLARVAAVRSRTVSLAVADTESV